MNMINYGNLDKKYEKFIFDTSSLIYTYKTEVLHDLLNNYKILVTKGVMEEISEKGDFLYEMIIDSSSIGQLEEIPHRVIDSKLSYTDTQIYLLSEKYNIPVVTEDKRIISHLEQNNMIHFNSLIMVFFLVKKGYYDKKTGVRKLFDIGNIAWYSDRVFDSVFNLIHKIK